MADRKVMRFAGRLTYTVLFVAFFVILGKICQYAAVEYLEPRLGFNLASLIGVAPFAAILPWLRNRFPRWFSVHGAWGRSES